MLVFRIGMTFWNLRIFSRYFISRIVKIQYP